MMMSPVSAVTSRSFGKLGALDDQRMIARRLEGRGHVLEHALALVADARQLAVHGHGRAHDLAAEHLADRLMAEADAEQRHLRLGRRLDQVHADAGFVGRARAGRQHDACGLQRHRLVDRDLVVAMHGAARPEIAQKVDEVVGEAVVVIDQQKHGTTPSAGGSKYRWRVPTRRPQIFTAKCRWSGVHDAARGAYAAGLRGEVQWVIRNTGKSPGCWRAGGRAGDDCARFAPR